METSIDLSGSTLLFCRCGDIGLHAHLEVSDDIYLAMIDETGNPMKYSFISIYNMFCILVSLRERGDVRFSEQKLDQLILQAKGILPYMSELEKLFRDMSPN